MSEDDRKIKNIVFHLIKYSIKNTNLPGSATYKYPAVELKMWNARLLTQQIPLER